MAVQKKTKIAPETYTEGVGRRKTAIARVRISKKGKGIFVNDMPYQEYFKRAELMRIVKEPLETLNIEDVTVNAHVEGGGIHAQAEAVRHGIARSLAALHPEKQKQLRSKNFLTRDPRMKERRKFGLKKARRAPQWSKR